MKQLYLTQINILCHSKIFTNQGYMFCYKKGKNIFSFALVFVEDVTNKHYAAHNSLYCFGIAT